MVSTNIRYALINNEIVYTIKFDSIDEITYDLLDSIDYSSITCVCFIGDAETSKEIVEMNNHIKEMNKNTKVAWFTHRTTMPFMSGKFDYIKLQNALYMKLESLSNMTAKFYDISNIKIELNPLDPYYYNKVEELKKLL